ncbi:MAG: helix-turn-helix domain-containing protein [Clostridia bacterium]|nr:helix-turn-helix domain-containing protein [Clostridia bacterium]
MQYDNKVVGQVIRTAREEKKLSQELLSGFAGIARSHLSMIESGRKYARLDTIWKIAAALEISPSELIARMEQAEDKK